MKQKYLFQIIALFIAANLGIMTSNSYGQNDTLIFWGKYNDAGPGGNPPVDLGPNQVSSDQPTNSSLMRAKASGEDITKLADLDYTPYDIDLDESAKKVYWVDNATSNVYSIPFNGGTPTLSAAFNWRTIAVSVADTDSDLYVSATRDVSYCSTGSSGGTGDSAQECSEGGVFRAPIGAGTSTAFSYSPISQNALKPGTGNIALDVSGGKMYWTVGSAVMRANLDGSNSESLALFGKRIADIAIDSANGRVYTTRLAHRVFTTSPNSLFGAIYQMDRLGATEHEVYSGSTSRGLMLRKVAVNLTNGDVYTLDKDTVADRLYLYNANSLTSYDAGIISDLAPETISDLKIDSLHGKVYVSSDDNSTGGIYRCNMDGTNAEIFAGGVVTSMAIDMTGSRVYWVDINGVVRSNTLDSSSPGVPFALGTGSRILSIDINLTAGKLYWIQEGPAEIYRSDLDGSNKELLISESISGETEFAILSSQNKIIFVSEKGLEVQDLDGSNRSVFMSTGETLRYLRVDEQNNKIFWYNQTQYRIEESDLDGSNRFTLASISYLGTSFVLDPSLQTVFFSDGSDIYSIGYDGSNFDYLTTLPSSIPIKGLGLGNSNNLIAVETDIDSAATSVISISRTFPYNYTTIATTTGSSHSPVDVFVDANSDIYFYDIQFDTDQGLVNNPISAERYIVRVRSGTVSRWTLHRFYNGNPMYWDASNGRIYWSTSAGIYWDNKSDLYELLQESSPLGVAYPGQLVTYQYKFYPDEANSQMYYSTGFGGQIHQSAWDLSGDVTRYNGGDTIEDVFFTPTPTGDVYWADSGLGGQRGVWHYDVTLATSSQLFNSTIAGRPYGIAAYDPPIWQLSGTVTLEGTPINGQLVDAGNSNGTTTTDLTGAYSFSLPDNTSIALTVTRPGYVFSEILGRTLSFTLNQDEVRSFNGIANRITGYARWATVGQEPAQGVTVTDGTRVAVTGSNGYYELVAVPNGSYTVSGTLVNYNVYVDAGVNPVTISDGSSSANLWVQPRYSVSGTVSIEGQPSNGQTVDGGASLSTSATNSSGNYLFSNILSGTAVDLSVTRPGYVFSEVLGRALSFTLNQNEIRNFNGIANRITGYARWATEGQEPAQGVTVTDGTRVAVTDTNGYYELVAIPNGSYTISGVLADYFVYVEPGVNPVTISDGSTTANLWVQPSGRLNKISGYVRWANITEDPVSGVTITDGTRSTTSDGSGYYELLSVPNGTYTVTGTLGSYKIEAEPGANPVVINNQDKVVNLWVTPEASPVVIAPWNGFLNVTAIAEVINVGTEPLDVTITLFRMDGNLSVGLPGTIHTSLAHGEQRDFVLNAMEGFEQDRYGVVKLEFNHTSYNGRVIYYKPKGSSPRSWKENYFDDFDYVFVNPFVGPLQGKSFVSFNTYQPSSAQKDNDHLVPNWLTLINADTASSQYFRIRKYSENGEILAPSSTVGTVQEVCKVEGDYLRCKVNPMGRIDIDGGHVLPGPNHIGQVDIEPEDPNAKYSANLIRYGMNAPPTIYTTSYSFGAYFQTRPGSSKTQIVPVWRIGGADSWVEVSNVLDTPADVTVRYYDYEGNELGVLTEHLSAKESKHFEASRFLPENGLGVAWVNSSTPEALIAQVAVYYRDMSGAMTAMLSVQGREPFNQKIYGTFNTFLSAYNYLKIVNLTDTQRTLKLTAGNEVKTVVLNPRGGMDLELKSGLFNLESNSLGVVSIEDSEPGKIFSQVIRVKPSSETTYDFIIATDVE